MEGKATLSEAPNATQETLEDPPSAEKGGKAQERGGTHCTASQSRRGVVAVEASNGAGLHDHEQVARVVDVDRSKRSHARGHTEQASGAHGRVWLREGVSQCEHREGVSGHSANRQRTEKVSQSLLGRRVVN
jgi:hypothetical protein